MTSADFLLTAAVLVGAAYILIARLRRRRLPLLCGMGMIASSCVLEHQVPLWLSLTVTLVWMTVPLVAVWRKRVSGSRARDDALTSPGETWRDGTGR